MSKVPKCRHFFHGSFFAMLFGSARDLEVNVIDCKSGFCKVMACDGNCYILTEEGTQQFPAGTLCPYDGTFWRHLKMRQED